MSRYTTDPQEVYTLELNKLQRCFSDIAGIGEEISGLVRVQWKQVEYLRQMNFILLEAVQVGELISHLALDTARKVI